MDMLWRYKSSVNNAFPIILLCYVKLLGEVRRGLTVLKMCGSMHDKDIMEFRIDDREMYIGGQFRNVTGILADNPMYVPREDIERLDGMFQEEAHER
jgi:circadian clock protein KaiC